MQAVFYFAAAKILKKTISLLILPHFTGIRVNAFAQEFDVLVLVAFVVGGTGEDVAVRIHHEIAGL